MPAWSILRKGVLSREDALSIVDHSLEAAANKRRIPGAIVKLRRREGESVNWVVAAAGPILWPRP
jgi:hypothetical protein